jgi:hypothetical protein
MINIANFLSSGESSLYSRKPGLLQKAATALILPLAIGMLSAGAGAISQHDTASFAVPGQHAQVSQLNTFKVTGAQSDQVLASVIAGANGHGYNVDGNTLLLQALLDPGMSTRVASSTSAVLDSFVASLPSGIKTSVVGDVSAAQLAKSMQDNSPDGVALSEHTNEGSACIVYTMGASRTLPNGQLAQFVDFNDALYVASGDSSDVTTTLHELAHCHPNAVMELDNHPLSVYYESSVRELRSDLAVVLYGASQTGSFEQGLDNVTTLRGATPMRPSHATVGMLEAVTQQLDAKSFVGMPANQVISAAVNIVNGMNPATNKDLRLAFAKDAWTYKLVSMGQTAGPARDANSNYANFAGQPFKVDMTAHANTIVNRSLNHALSQADTVRASKAMSVSRVETFAKGLGLTLSPEQRAKAEFVDGAITPVGTAVSKDGALASTQSPFTMKGLESSVQGDLNGMLANGLIQRSGANTASSKVDATEIVSPQKHSLNKTFGSAFKALETAIAQQEASTRLQESNTWRGPRL